MSEIYDKDRMKCRTNIQQLNILFTMGQELEAKVDEINTAIQEINARIQSLME